MYYKKKNVTAISIVFIVVIMVGLSFASVPLYDLFCRTTGFGGTPVTNKNINESKSDKDLSMRVIFNADIAHG